MKKKLAWSGYANNPSIKKLILMSKIVFLLFFAGLLQVSAASYAQKTKMDLKMMNASMIDVFEKIEAQSEFRFFYDNSQVDLKQNVTVNLTDRKIEDILDEIFKNTNITYEVLDRHILITSKGTSPEVTTQDATRIKGKVTSEADRQSLPGVSVIVKGTAVGVITDGDGNYSINVPAGGKVLVFSFIGMAPKEVVIGDQSIINVSLAENMVSVDEVVVIGYGTVKKSDLTGSVAVVSTKELTKNPASSVSAALQGKAPGVLVMQNAEPGGGAHIRVRGIGSINGSSEPLYIVDGVVGSINGIQPQEIESMQILKDASASAIYGANGSNGVVIITTKRGKPGKAQVSLNTYVGVTMAPKQYDMMNADEYSNFYKSIYGDRPEYNQAFREKYYGQGWQEGTNWQDQMFKTGLNQNYHLSISGGGENSNYQISMGYVKEDGTVIKNNAERYTIRANSDFKIGSHLKMGESISMNYNVRETPMTNQIGIYDLLSSPLMKVHNSFYKGGFESPQTIYWEDENGDLQQGTVPNGYSGPIYSNTMGNDKPNQLAAPSLGDNKNYGLGTRANVYMQIDFTKWLMFKTTPAAEVNYGRSKAWMPRFTGNRAPGSASLSENYYEGIALYFENQLLFNKQLGNHNIQATAVHQVQSGHNNSISGAETGFDFEQLNTLSNGGTSASVLKGYSSQGTRMLSYLGRIIYGYQDKYLFTGSYRSDGISQFGPEMRRGHFLSGSVAWKIKEDFLKDVEQIDALKLRAGWGQTGNSAVGKDFEYVDKITESTEFSPVFGDDQHIARAQYILYGLANPKFSWETAEMTNIGFDLNMFKNKLQINAEYYIKDNNDLLVAINSSAAYGRVNGNPWYNAGNIRNSGVELSLQWREKKGNFEYGFISNFTTVKNEVKYLPVEDITNGNNRTIEGHSIGALYGYVSEGIIQLDESNYTKDAEGNFQQIGGEYTGYLHATHESNVPQPGDIKYKDLNGDGDITPLDKTIIGRTMPSFIYSFGFDCNYKNFDFNIFFYGLTDFQIFNAQRANLSSMNSQDMDHNKLNDFARNHWTLENASTTQVRVDPSNRNMNDRISTFWIEDGSFLRVKDVQLGYTLGRNTASRAGVGSVRLYVNASNLFCFTNYKGRDPEGFISNDPKNGGTDNGNYSMPRAFTGGLQIEF